jgi:peptide/nickel transport system permease protein
LSWILFIGALGAVFLSLGVPTSTLKGKFLSLIAVMLGATIIVSGSLRLVPGDPIDHILGDQALSSSRDLLARELGLVDEAGNKTGFVQQYAHFMTSITKNDLKSYINRRPALTRVLERLPYTVLLSLAVMLVAIMFGPLFGVVAALFHHRLPDHLLSIFALIGVSVPSFFLGPLLLLLFAIHWQLLPISGADNGFYSLILPAFSMGMALSAMLARMSRASMLEVLSEDYVRTAHAKGLPAYVVFFKHALRNALIPVTTIVGLQFGAVLAGSVITEKIFNWPGIGLLLLEAIQQLDMPVVQVCVLLIAFIYAAINLGTDLLYTVLDPRINIGEKANEST